jgi:hypothetical protein
VGDKDEVLSLDYGVTEVDCGMWSVCGLWSVGQRVTGGVGVERDC